MAEDLRHVCERRWICHTGLHSQHGEFTVMTYNILANIHILPGVYTYCPESVRYENARAPHIIAEVQSYSPDVVCFQEVSEYHYTSMLKRHMGNIGYLGFHMTYRYRTHDGLCIFYKSSQFTLLNERRFQIEDLVHSLAAVGVHISPSHDCVLHSSVASYKDVSSNGAYIF